MLKVRLQSGETVLYSVGECAEKLHVSTYTIVRYIRRNTIPGVKIARSWYITEKNLSDYLNASQTHGNRPRRGSRREVVYDTDFAMATPEEARESEYGL